MTNQPKRIVVLQSLILLAVVAPLLAAAAYAWHTHDVARARLAELEPRHARLQGIIARQLELQAAAQNAAQTVNRYFYPASVDAARAGNEAQQQIRAAFESGNMSIVSAQVLDPKDSDGFQRIRLVFLVEGTLSELQEVLLKLKVQSPAVLVESLSMQAQGQPRASSLARVNGNFNFVVLRAKS